MINFFEALLIVFIALKLCGVIAWSWWWVLCPFWIPCAVFAMALFLAYLVGEIS